MSAEPCSAEVDMAGASGPADVGGSERFAHGVALKSSMGRGCGCPSGSLHVEGYSDRSFVMPPSVAETLHRLNTRFYAEHAGSFSSTRSTGWDGWRRLLGMLRDQGFSWGDQLTVLDVASGNFRFERFLAESLPDAGFTFRCIDNCVALAQEGVDVGSLPNVSMEFDMYDVIARLLCGEKALPDTPRADLTVSWGFLHHVPTQMARVRLVRELLQATRAGGCVAVSCWRFADEPERREKALVTTVAGCDELGIGQGALEEGDYLLGWQGMPGAYRYCHSFSDGEIRHIIDAVSDLATVVAAFRADGKSGTLNEYLVFLVAG